MTRSVKVILLQEISHLGQKNELKSVALGFAKNWLIPKKLAVVATPTLIAQARKEQATRQQRQAQKASQYESLAKELKGFTLKLRPKKNKKGTLYEGIDATVIAAKLKDKKIAITPEMIELEIPIKQVGEYEVPVALSKNYQATIKIVVQ